MYPNRKEIKMLLKGKRKKETDNRFWFPELSNIHPNAKIGVRNIIHSFVWIGENVIIGNDCRIQAFVFIPPGVTIADKVFIGPNVTFTNDKNPPSEQWAKTKVGRGASIGAGSVILPGINIGENAIIGAGSVVTKDVPSGETWVGNPAKKIAKKESIEPYIDPFTKEKGSFHM